MARFILIHGTTQSPAGWQRLAQALEARGHRAEAADLPSDQPDLRVDDYAEIVREQVGADGDTIVVAHSASGLVLPATARALNAKRQVWLAAWVPNPTMSLIEEVEQHADAAFAPGWVGKDATADPAVARHFLFHDCDGQTLKWALTTLRLFFPRAAYAQRVTGTTQQPSTYIVASDDRTIRPDWQRLMARKRLGVEPLEIAAGHCPHVSQPDHLADLLAEVANPL